MRFSTSMRLAKLTLAFSLLISNNAFCQEWGQSYILPSLPLHFDGYQRNIPLQSSESSLFKDLLGPYFSKYSVDLHFPIAYSKNQTPLFFFDNSSRSIVFKNEDKTYSEYKPFIFSNLSGILNIYPIRISESDTFGLLTIEKSPNPWIRLLYFNSQSRQVDNNIGIIPLYQGKCFVDIDFQNDLYGKVKSVFILSKDSIFNYEINNFIPNHHSVCQSLPNFIEGVPTQVTVSNHGDRIMIESHYSDNNSDSIYYYQVKFANSTFTDWEFWGAIGGPKSDQFTYKKDSSYELYPNAAFVLPGLSIFSADDHHFFTMPRGYCISVDSSFILSKDSPNDRFHRIGSGFSKYIPLSDFLLNQSYTENSTNLIKITSGGNGSINILRAPLDINSDTLQRWTIANTWLPNDQLSVTYDTIVTNGVYRSFYSNTETSTDALNKICKGGFSFLKSIYPVCNNIFQLEFTNYTDTFNAYSFDANNQLIDSLNLSDRTIKVANDSIRIEITSKRLHAAQWQTISFQDTLIRTKQIVHWPGLTLKSDSLHCHIDSAQEFYTYSLKLESSYMPLLSFSQLDTNIYWTSCTRENWIIVRNDYCGHMIDSLFIKIPRDSLLFNPINESLSYFPGTSLKGDITISFPKSSIVQNIYGFYQIPDSATKICFNKYYSDTILIIDFCDTCYALNSRFYIANSFVPSGINKSIGPICSHVQETEWAIYNSWGECVFKSNSCEEKWLGTSHGTLCPIGIYILVYQYVDVNGVTHKGSETIHLL